MYNNFFCNWSMKCENVFSTLINTQQLVAIYSWFGKLAMYTYNYDNCM